MSWSRPKRIALVSPYDFAAPGGVTEHIRQLSARLEQQGISTTIIAPSSGDHLPQPNLVSLGSITPVRINGSVARPTLSPKVMEDVSQLLRREQFDIIHLHEPLAPMLPLSVLNASDSANVGTFHASGHWSLGYATTGALLRWLAQRLTVRIAVSLAAASFIQRYVPGEYAIIPNGVDTTRFHPDMPPWPDLDDGRPNVLFVGRFDEPRKGLDVLLQAWPDVRRACPESRLLIGGRGNVDELQARLDRQGLAGVKLLGPIPAADLPRWYRTATVFCAPSTGQESFGIILVEALSSGVPVVASDIDGYRSVIQHRRQGLLVPPEQPPALAAGLIQLLSQPDIRIAMAETGRQTSQEYDWSRVTDRVIQTYERAVWEHRAARQRLPQRFVQPQLVPLLVTSTALKLPAVTIPVATIEGRSAGLDRQGAATMLTESFEARVRAWTQRVVGRVLGRSGISPNTLTALGLVLTMSVTLTLAKGHLRWGGFLVLITSAFDMLDGALARATDQKSAFGAFLDSTVDRFSEALIFLGLLLFYQGQPGSQWLTSLVYVSIVGSLMVSYTRARAEALGFSCKVGLLGRPERIILLAFGLVVGWLPFALAILAIFTNITVIQRIVHVWHEDRKRNPRPVVTKPARRSWFVPRDQKPS